MFPPIPLPYRPGKFRSPFTWCLVCGMSITMICLLHTEPPRKTVAPAASIPLSPYALVAAAPSVHTMCEVESGGPELRGPVVPHAARQTASADEQAAGKIFRSAGGHSPYESRIPAFLSLPVLSAPAPTALLPIPLTAEVRPAVSQPGKNDSSAPRQAKGQKTGI